LISFFRDMYNVPPLPIPFTRKTETEITKYRNQAEMPRNWLEEHTCKDMKTMNQINRN